MDPAEKYLRDMTLSRRRGMLEASARGDSEVQRFYYGRSVFLTGGSGFLGKQLIEKLLRSCKISKVYMLLRSKKGKTIQQRLEDFVKEPVFDTLREQQPDFSSKLVAIGGDVSEMRLGIQNEDWNTITKEVDVIFHIAATTRFDEPLRVATIINIRGTRECIKLGKACKNLCAFVHLSTAYTQTPYSLMGKDVREQFFKCPLPPEAMISIAEEMDDERLSSISANLLKGWASTYFFTKAITEELIKTSTDDLPICIVRPGIVTSSVCEPYPGWIDYSAVYSATGILVGTRMGVLHTLCLDDQLVIGLIPCDYVNNTIIVAGKETAVKLSKGGIDTKIYAVTSSYRNPLSHANLISHTLNLKAFHDFPTPKAVYHPYVMVTKNIFLYKILNVFLHRIPAYLADFVCLLFGKERRFVKTAEKIYKMTNTLCTALAHFTNKILIINDDNTSALYNNLTEQDRIIFNFNITDINWKEYTQIWFLGIRKYIIKDGLKDSEYASKKYKLLKMVHYIITPMYVYSFWKVLCYVMFVINYGRDIIK